MGPFAPPPPPGAQPAPLWGSEGHLRELFADRVDFATLEREELTVTAFERAQDYGEHFKARYGPALAARANAERNGQTAEFDEALDRFCDCSPWAPAPRRAPRRCSPSSRTRTRGP
ncbi:MAG TPA: hypothetical protein VNB64_04080 [Solirubrobacteraceae bacterium]|nr:hypothetical protein [Solirubrobacteraceae bacterium]